MTNRRSPRPAAARRQRGFNLVEILVGVVIGLIAVLVIYQVFAVSEALKRNTSAAGDAQTAGIFSTFLLAQEIGNAGSGIANAADDLANCPNTADIRTTMRPIPILITDGGADDVSDSFVVNYSVARRLVTPANFTAAAAAGADFKVQSPSGFAKGDYIVAMDGTANCASSMVTGAPSAPDANGIVSIPHSALGAFSASSQLMNYGPVDKVQRTLYDVSGESLRSRSLLDPATGKPVDDQPTNPIANNIALLKVQYGIDTNGDGILDTWVRGKADDGGDPATVLAMDATNLSHILAVRIGLIIRSDQPVSKFDANGSADTEWQQLSTNGGFQWTLFDCLNKLKCPNRLTGTIPQFNGQYYRYRVYEQVIPLRNLIWNHF
jgi:type IV pilus assembly protein PilW